MTRIGDQWRLFALACAKVVKGRGDDPDMFQIAATLRALHGRWKGQSTACSVNWSAAADDGYDISAGRVTIDVKHRRTASRAAVEKSAMV